MSRRLLPFAIVIAGCSGSGPSADDDVDPTRDAGPRRDAGTVVARDGGEGVDASTNPPAAGLSIQIGARAVGPSFDMGQGFVGERERPRTLTLINSGTEAITFHPSTPVTVFGASGEFRVTDPEQATLAPGATTSFTIEFAPTTAGRSEASLRVHHESDAIGPTSFTVFGYGHASGTPMFIGGGGAFVRTRTVTGDPGTWVNEGDRAAPDPCPNFGDDHPRDLIRGIGYGDGTFVLVGGSCVGMIATSKDGMQWSPQLLDPPYAGFYEDVVFQDGAFVAVGGLGGRARSTDGGETWNVVGEYSKCHLRRAAVGNGRIVAVGNMFDMGCYSATDDGGQTWTPIGDGGPIYQTIAYGNGIFVASGTDRCDTSPDGVTWTPCDASAPRGNAVWFANGEFVTFGGSGITTSVDGVTWSTIPGPWFLVAAYGAGRYVGAGVTQRGTGATLDTIQIESEGSPLNDWVFGHAAE